MGATKVEGATHRKDPLLSEKWLARVWKASTDVSKGISGDCLLNKLYPKWNFPDFKHSCTV